MNYSIKWTVRKCTTSSMPIIYERIIYNTSVCPLNSRVIRIHDILNEIYINLCLVRGIRNCIILQQLCNFYLQGHSTEVLHYIYQLLINPLRHDLIIIEHLSLLYCGLVNKNYRAAVRWYNYVYPGQGRGLCISHWKYRGFW